MQEMLPKSFNRPEMKFVLFLAWIVVPSVVTLLGFYLGTIFGNREHVVDLQVKDIESGLLYAKVFCVLSLIGGAIATRIFPAVIEKDYADREAKWDAASHGHHH